MTPARVPGCTGKSKYATEQAARERADAPSKRKPKGTIHVYQCGACHCWHLTHWAPERQAHALAVTQARREGQLPPREVASQPWRR